MLKLWKGKRSANIQFPLPFTHQSLSFIISFLLSLPDAGSLIWDTSELSGRDGCFRGGTRT